MTRTDYDVLVIGAGIIGNFITKELSRLGHSVGVIEKKPETGHKICCTGIISNECFDLLRVPPSIVQNKVHSARIFSPSGKCMNLNRNDTQAYVLDRPALDKFIANSAASIGAEYHFNVMATNLKLHDNYIQVNCSGTNGTNDLKGKVVVIAAGFNNSLTLDAGMGKIDYYAMAAQTEVEIGNNIDEIEIYSGSEIAPGFFAWLVPAGRLSAKVGLLCKQNPAKFMSAFIQKLTNAGKIGKTLRTVNYAMIPLKPLRKTYSDRVIAVGDAAGQVKPTTGGGIYFGLLSACEAIKVLNNALISDDLSEKYLSLYQKRWHHILSRELNIDYWAHRFYQKLDDHQIDHIFDIIERYGIHDTLLASPDITFDWHSKIILDAIRHRSLQRSLKKINKTKISRFIVKKDRI